MEKLNELIELAKKATKGAWVADSGEGWDAIIPQQDMVNSNFIIGEFIGPDSTVNKDFVLAASPENILAIAEAFRALEQENILLKQGCENNPLVHEMLDWKERAEAAEEKLAELERQEPRYQIQKRLSYGRESLWIDVASREEAENNVIHGFRWRMVYDAPAPAPAADLVPIGRVERGEVSDNNEYPNARVVCLHDQADWENFPDGTELFLRPDPAVGMDKPEPYAWLVHAPQGDYVERNPEVVAHLEGTGLTRCKPLYLDL